MRKPRGPAVWILFSSESAREMSVIVSSLLRQKARKPSPKYLSMEPRQSLITCSQEENQRPVITGNSWALRRRLSWVEDWMSATSSQQEQVLMSWMVLSEFVSPPLVILGV